MLTKEHVLTALRAWINQRPGLEFGNYGELSAYRSELRRITRQRRDALELLSAVALRPSITAENIIDASKRAYSGRLTITEDDKGRAKLEYCTGQYWPTEYRAAVCAVLASALWDRARADMPPPQGKVTRITGKGPFQHETEHDSIDGLSPGDWIRRHFRREFGRTIQSRYFD
jgi:hypothetical protein